MNVVQGSHSQGSDIFPFSSRGKQCMSMSFMFLVFSHAHENNTFTMHDLNLVMEAGDSLYHEIVQEDPFLLASELPESLKFKKNYYSCRLQETHFGNMANMSNLNSDSGISLENSLNKSFARNNNACILIFHSSAVAVKSCNDRFLVFDSHCRGIDGLCDPNGKCSLTSLDNFGHLCKFLRLLCQSISSIPVENVQFELNVIGIKSLNSKPRHFCGPVVMEITKNMKTKKRRYIDVIENIQNAREVKLKKKSEENVLQEENGLVKIVKQKGSCYKVHENASQGTYGENTIHNHSPDCLLTFPPNVIRQSENTDDFDLCDAPNNPSHCEINISTVPSCTNRDRIVITPDTTKAIEGFKRLVSSGPLFICTCCTQTWFKDGVKRADTFPKSELVKKCFLGLLSVNEIEWVCHTCQRHLRLGKIPPFAVVNGFKFPEIPPELELTEMEERLISPRIPFMQLVEKPRGGQRSLRGNVVNVPSDVNKTITSLPRTLAETETIQVKLKRKLQFKHHVMYESIRPAMYCCSSLANEKQ